jgi:hypothetical protein
VLEAAYVTATVRRTTALLSVNPLADLAMMETDAWTTPAAAIPNGWE